MVMTAPVPPIFIVEWPDNVDVYASSNDAALSLEPWWVEEALGAAYDAEGRLLGLEIHKYNVVITLGEQTPTHASELRTILLSYLQALGYQTGLEAAADLPSLIRICVERANIVLPES